MILENLVSVLQPFMDRDGRAYIRGLLATVERQEDLPLDSDLARDIVQSKLAQILPRRLPMAKDLRAALSALRGAAYENNRQQANLGTNMLLDQYPLAKVVLHISRVKGGTTAEATRLLSIVNNVAVRLGIDTAAATWPTSANAIGRQLSILKPKLAEVGCLLEYNENARPRTWRIPPAFERVESDSEVSSSTHSSQSTSETLDTLPFPKNCGNTSGDALSDEQLNAITKEIM